MRVRHEAIIPSEWKKIIENKKSQISFDDSAASTTLTYIRLEHSKICRNKAGKCPACRRNQTET